MTEELAKKLDSIHSRLFACYVMNKMGHKPDLDVLLRALNELEALYSDIPDAELAELQATR